MILNINSFLLKRSLPTCRIGKTLHVHESDIINLRDVQIKNVVNNVDMSCLKAP